MLTLRLHLRRLSSIAFVAIFALALLPTASRLLAHATGGSAWAEICTPQGLKAATAKGEKPLPTLVMHLDHCAMCGLAGSSIAPPPAVVLGVAIAPVRSTPPLFDAAPRPLHAWATVRARGPPMTA